MACWLRWCVEMETIWRISIWRTFGRIQWHVIPEPCITLQGAATWWIHCHNSRATCHIAGCSHLAKSMSWSCHIQGVRIPSGILKIVFHHIMFFLFLMQFRLWWAAAFVLSPIHLFIWCLKTFLAVALTKGSHLSSLSSVQGRQQLSCPVLRPPSGPNACPQDNIPLHKGNNENSLELIPIKEIITSQELEEHSKMSMTKAKGYILL